MYVPHTSAVRNLFTLSQQLLADPPAWPCPPLTTLLDTISKAYPQVFYKPFFTCAASSKEYAVMNHLCIITALSKFQPDLWWRNSEMMSIVLTTSDVGGRKATSNGDAASPSWGTARLGQLVLCLELTGKLQKLRHVKDQSSVSDHSFIWSMKISCLYRVKNQEQ